MQNSRMRPKTAQYSQYGKNKKKEFRPVSGISTIPKKSFGGDKSDFFNFNNKSRIKSGKSYKSSQPYNRTMSGKSGTTKKQKNRYNSITNKSSHFIR